MGQARLRGAYEERKAAAIAKREAVRAEREKGIRQTRRPVNRDVMMLMALKALFFSRGV